MSPDTPPPFPDDEYSPQHVEVLRDCAHIRRRPGMYIGDTGSKGLHNLLLELVGRFLDDFRAGIARRLTVELLADHGCRFSHDGSAPPVKLIAQSNKTVAEKMMTVMFVPGTELNFALITANALSERCVLETISDGKLWRQEYERGEPTGPLEPLRDTSGSGMSLTFWPDAEIFQETRDFDYDLLAERFREFAATHPGAELCLLDHRVGREPVGDVFLAPDGLLELLRHRRQGQSGLHDPIQLKAKGTLPEDGQNASFDCVLLWSAEPGGNLLSFVNERRTANGGSHVGGLQSAVTRAVKQFARGQGIDVSHCTGDDVRECLTAIVSMHLVSPLYSGMTTERLGNPDAERFVQTLAYRQLLAHLRQHPDAARRIVDRVLQSAQERLAARKK